MIIADVLGIEIMSLADQILWSGSGYKTRRVEGGAASDAYLLCAYIRPKK